MFNIIEAQINAVTIYRQARSLLLIHGVMHCRHPYISQASVPAP